MFLFFVSMHVNSIPLGYECTCKLETAPPINVGKGSSYSALLCSPAADKKNNGREGKEASVQQCINIEKRTGEPHS